MLSEHGGSWPCESKHPYGSNQLQVRYRGPSTRTEVLAQDDSGKRDVNRDK